MPEAALRRTPLYDCHVRAGAKLVDFAGWEMPVRYSGDIEEHHAVRRAAGLFDVSHMGEIRIRGGGAHDFLQRLTPNDVSKLKPGRIHYTGLLTEAGTYVDDLLLYHVAEGDYLAVVNASNKDKDLAHILANHGPADDCEVVDQSDEYALIAIQGPLAPSILARHTDVDLEGMRYYRFREGEVCGRKCLVSRTGYTGELGFELYVAPADAAPIWDALLESGAEDGLKPAGLGARDTLRLEAGMALYGHEIDDQTTPWEAGLQWVVKLKAGDFLGREALVNQKENGVPRQLAGFEVRSKGVARQGYPVLVGGDEVALVASGSWSPTFDKAIGTALLPPEHAAPGTEIEIAVRKRRLEAVVVELPFYRRT